MDVILDSNAYLSDIRMESIRFKNLFDYLRRTKSSLVLPRLVREETVAKYKHLLETQAKKTAQAVDQLNRLIVDKKSEIHFSAPESKYGVRDLRAKLRAPAKGVIVRYYSETAGVDVGEVFLRGVRRRRPASSQGEELRDVIIWLIALQFAEAEQNKLL